MCLVFYRVKLSVLKSRSHLAVLSAALSTTHEKKDSAGIILLWTTSNTLFWLLFDTLHFHFTRLLPVLQGIHAGTAGAG